jgi:hypothetical protein
MVKILLCVYDLPTNIENYASRQNVQAMTIGEFSHYRLINSCLEILIFLNFT